ncbi:MAG: hypothetical protein K2M07_03110 [Muribaculaceae bacterium]|nr:hypothetical protein [Muribaculaceae bacterium]
MKNKRIGVVLAAAIIVALFAGGGIYYHYLGVKEKERMEEAARLAEMERQRQFTPENLDLAVMRGDRMLFFQQNNWKKKIEDGDQKIGVVIIQGDQRFILEPDNLEDYPGITWYEAMDRYADRLPTKEQAQAIEVQYKDIDKAMLKYFGSSISTGDNLVYWTRTESTPVRAWDLEGFKCRVSNEIKDFYGRARGVAPLP